MNSSKVSLLLVCYNSEAYVEKALESYINQDIGKSNFEVIVVDGGSSDQTLLKCKNF